MTNPRILSTPNYHPTGATADPSPWQWRPVERGNSSYFLTHWQAWFLIVNKIPAVSLRGIPLLTKERNTTFTLFRCSISDLAQGKTKNSNVPPEVLGLAPAHGIEIWRTVGQIQRNKTEVRKGLCLKWRVRFPVIEYIPVKMQRPVQGKACKILLATLSAVSWGSFRINLLNWHKITYATIFVFACL